MRDSVLNIKHGPRIRLVDIDPDDLFAVTAIVASLVPILPPWLLRLAVYGRPFGGKQPGDVASVDIDHEYRQASIYLHEGWRSEGDEQAHEYITHECAHIILAPLQRFADNATQNCDGAMKNMRSEAVESTTTDLATALHPFTYPLARKLLRCKKLDEATINAALSR